jgi:hypothetical protein
MKNSVNSFNDNNNDNNSFSHHEFMDNLFIYEKSGELLDIDSLCLNLNKKDESNTNTINEFQLNEKEYLMYLNFTKIEERTFARLEKIQLIETNLKNKIIDIQNQNFLINKFSIEYLLNLKTIGRLADELIKCQSILEEWYKFKVSIKTQEPVNFQLVKDLEMFSKKFELYLSCINIEN